MIEGVIFDKDGTLFDFKKSWGGWVRSLLKEMARDDDHAAHMAATLGFNLSTGTFEPDSPVIAATNAEIAEHVLPHLPGSSLAALVARMNLLAATAEMTEAVPLAPLLAALHERGLRVGLATNDVEEAARAHLQSFGVADQFDMILGCDSGHGAKPGPGMLLAFAAATGLAPSRVLMVGDSRHDLIAGRAAGMRTVAVLTGVAQAEDLAPLAEVVLPDVGALPMWIDVIRST
jgi:phosphoglycolate phosphatase